MIITRFGGILGWQLLTNAPSIAAGDLGPECTSSSPSLTVTMNSIETPSSITSTNEISIESIRFAVDANGKTHHLVLLSKAKDVIKNIDSAMQIMPKKIISATMFANLC